MKIMRQNDKKEKLNRMYGHTMRENPNKILSASFKRAASHCTNVCIESIEIESTDELDNIKIVYDDRKMAVSSSAFKRSDAELEIERAMLSTFQEVINKHDVKEIKCDDLLMEIKARFKNDVRYAYKPFRTRSLRNSRHSVYIYYLYAIIIATISIFNSIDFKAPIRMSLVKNSDYLTLKIETKLRRKLGTRRREEVLKAPENETKLLYIDMLCKNNNIENTFRLIDNKYILKYEFCEIEKEEIKLYSKDSEENDFFLRYMDIFNDREISREEE